MQKIGLWLVLAALIASLVGCESTSGSVTGSSTACSSSSSSGSCRGTLATLSGTYAQASKQLRIGVRSVTVNVHASVDKGSVRVYVVAPDGTEQGATATPEQPATFSAQAQASSKTFRVYFEAVEGTASGVSYSIDYTAP